MPKRHKFEHVMLQQVHYKDLGKKFYRVYKTLNEFVDIEAQTAYEAIANSQVQKPIMVELKVCRLTDFIHDPSLLQIEKPDQIQAESSEAAVPAQA